MRSQGDVYAKIIEEVIESSRTDFEEHGISPTTLQELQQVRSRPFRHGKRSCHIF